MQVVYVAGDGPLQGWAYAMDHRLQINQELELYVRDGFLAVYRVGQGCKLWFIDLLPQTT